MTPEQQARALAAKALQDTTNAVVRLGTAEAQLALKAQQSDLNTTNANVAANTTAITGKVDKNGAGQISLAMLSQAVKDAMTGGTIPYVGPNSVTEPTIQKGAVTRLKTSLFKEGKNLFNANDPSIIQNTFLNKSTSATATLANYFVSAYQDVTPGASYILSSIDNWAGDSNTGRHYYDENKVFISAEPCTFNAAFTIPAGAVYMRFTGVNARLSTIQLEKGSAKTLFEKYRIDLTDDYADQIKLALANSNNSNLINKDKLEQGFLGTNGTITVAPEYYTTDYENISGASALIATYTMGGTFACFYDQNKALVSTRVSISASQTGTILLVPAGVSYVRYSIPTTSLNLAMLQKGIVSQNFEGFGKVIPSSMLQSKQNSIVLPDKLYVAKGLECSIFHDNISYAPPELLKVFAKASVGSDYKRFYRYSPTAAAADSDVYFAAYNHTMDAVAQKKVTVRTVDTASLAGKPTNILILGDSFVGIGHFCVAIKTNLQAMGVNANFVGTCHGVSGSPFNISLNITVNGNTYAIPREGRSGGTLSEFVTNTQWNPWWNATSNTNDIATYLSSNSLATPDILVVQFTLNDLSAYEYKAQSGGIYETLIGQIKTIADAFKAANPNIKVIFSIEPPGAINFANRNSMGKQASFLGFAEALFSTFNGTGAYGFVYIAPSYAWVDRVNGYGGDVDYVSFTRFPGVTEKFGGDSIHCNAGGMFQIGDCITSMIAAILNGTI